jgi:glycosyltransferase involved in cell wall biosynthesis
LRHLLDQKCKASIPWEVIVVDNASTDGTSDFVYKFWSNNILAELHVVRESRLGLSYARQRGFQEAKYECVSFVDDDNWVAPDWVENVYNVMSEHPEAGACGGKSEAVFEAEPPAWFKRHQGKYAVGNQGEISGDVTWTRGYLWGAGLTIRKSAWLSLLSNGFQPALIGRSGKILSAGEDSELCLALRLAGWKLWYDEKLSLKHFLPAGRLQWGYLRKLVRGFGSSSVELSPYLIAHAKDFKDLQGRTGKIWIWKLRAELEVLWQLRRKWFRSQKQLFDDDDEVLEIEHLIGSLTTLLSQRNHFDSRVYSVWNAPWNTIHKHETIELSSAS